MGVLNDKCGSTLTILFRTVGMKFLNVMKILAMKGILIIFSKSFSGKLIIESNTIRINWLSNSKKGTLCVTTYTSSSIRGISKSYQRAPWSFDLTWR